MVASTIHSSLQKAQQRSKENDQGQPRPARVRFSVKTSGIGESRLTNSKAIDFGAFLLDEPTFSFGIVTLDTLAVGELPLCTATVLRWKQTAAGLYAGAEVGFKVESMKYNIRLKFSLTFEGSTLRTTVGTGTETMTAPRGTNTYNGVATISSGDL